METSKRKSWDHRNLILELIIFALIIIIGISYGNNSRLGNQIKQRDNLIKDMVYRDSLYIDTLSKKYLKTAEEYNSHLENDIERYKKINNAIDGIK